MKPIEKVLNFIGFRKQSYQQTFNPENRFNVAVLEDLAKFCRADRSTFHPDPRVHAVLEGRRETYLRIMQHLSLSTEDLAKLFTKETT